MINNKYLKIFIAILVILAILAIFMIKKFFYKDNNTQNDINKVQIYESNLQVKKVLHFKSDGCIPCKNMEVLLRELKEEYAGRVEILQIDIYENQDLANKYNVMYTPTQIFLDENDRVISTYVGFIGKSNLRKAIENGGNINGIN